MNVGNNDGTNVISNISYFIIALVVFLVPFFFVPGLVLSPIMAKSLLLVIGVVLAVVFFIISLIKNAKISIPKNLLSLSLVLVPVTFLVSALLTGATSSSFLGYNLDVGTVLFLAVGAVMTFLVAEIFRSKEKAFFSHIAFFISLLIVAIYQAVRIISDGSTLDFGIFVGKTSSLVGSWNEMGILFGLSAILSLITLEMIELKKSMKVAIASAFAISILFLIIVNFSTIWYMTGVFALIFFLYVISFDQFKPSKALVGEGLGADMNLDQPRPKQVRRISWGALILLVISVAFIFKGATIGQQIADTLGTSHVEVRPSWSATFAVMKGTLSSSPVVGVGPNNFVYMWQKFRPSGIGTTLFWNTDFSYGIGLLPTFVVTTGLLGILAWVFFLLMFVRAGLQSIFSNFSDSFSKYLTLSSFLAALFLWLTTIFYVPSVAVMTLAFFFTGLFLASLYREGALKLVDVSFSHHPKLSFLSVFLLVILLIGSLSLGYIALQKSVAVGYFQKGFLIARDVGDVDRAEALITKAVNLDSEDIYQRTLSEIYIFRINNLLANENISTEDARIQFQQYVSRSIESARLATEINPNNYQNWSSLAQVYASLVPAPFSIPGAYENAKNAYDKAKETNPTSAAIPLLMARLEASNGDLKASRVLAEESIALKANYADAHFLMAQIEVTEGNLTKAIPSLETAIVLSPNDPGLLFQLGLLKYSNSDWNGAIEVFVAAINAVPEYANAKYFLGLSLDKIGRRDDAILFFEDLAITNSDNAEVALILSNLKADKDPFTGAQPPIDSNPERRAEPPLKESE